MPPDRVAEASLLATQLGHLFTQCMDVNRATQHLQRGVGVPLLRTGLAMTKAACQYSLGSISTQC